MVPNITTIEAIFSEALEIPSAEGRAAYLDRACAADPELRRQVESLIDAHDRAGRFLASPTVSFETGPPEPAGSTVGPYKLMEPIGEGGMGVVYVAEQTRPVRRKVALKIIKPGMDTKQVIARFEAERQALAMMDHPNIAHVLDGGATDSGGPYFVMELVRGIPITDYCDRERLSIPDRLELFVLVCRAVQHAHQKGIIHRDLKPSNILITVIDGAAVPKVIDFGVAKATGASLTDRTIYTAFHQFVGTPLYMSPEQADLAGVDVDTRSDIYSLGVLLYELLTGTTPFDQDTFRQAAFDELRRIIREQEPPKPSTRLSSLGTTRATISAHRKADARQLDRTVRGELDWIVMKALEKDRRRRYETANDFASDVMRYLTDQPVEACPPSAWYRFRKFVSRNRKGLATLALSTVSGLVVALALGTIYLQNAGRARRVTQDVRQALAGARTAIEARDLTLAGQRVAEAQGRLGADGTSLRVLAAEIGGIRREIDARRSDAARFDQFLKGANDAQDKMGYGHDPGGERLAEETLGLYGILTDEDWSSRLESSYLTADQKQQVRETAYVTLVTLADAGVRTNGDPVVVARSLDLLRRAQAFHQPTRAFYFVRRICREHQGNGPAVAEEEKLFRAAAARTAWDYYLPGHTAGWRGDGDEAIRSYEAALALQPDHYNSLFYLGLLLAKHERGAEAIAYFTACIAVRPDHLLARFNRGANHLALGHLDAAKADFEVYLARARDDRQRCGAMMGLAVVMLDKGQHREAQELLQRSIAIAEPLLAKSPEDQNILYTLFDAHRNRGNSHLALGEFDAAKADYEAALALAWDDQLRCRAIAGLAAVMLDKGQHREALELRQRAIAIAEPLVAKSPGDRVIRNLLVDIHLDLGNSHLALGQLDAAKADFEAALALARDDLRRYRAMGGLAGVMFDKGQHREAQELLQRAIAIGEPLVADSPKDRKYLGKLFCLLAAAMVKNGQHREAQQLMRRTIAIYEPSSKDPNSPEVFRLALTDLAWSLATCPIPKLRDPARAVELARKAVESAPRAGSWSTLGVALYRTGDRKAAIEALEKAQALEPLNDLAQNGFFLAMARWQLGQKDEARTWYDNAVAWMEKKAPGDPDLVRFRAEAAALLGLQDLPSDVFAAP